MGECNCMAIVKSKDQSSEYQVLFIFFFHSIKISFDKKINKL